MTGLDIALWVATGLLAAMYLMAGLMKAKDPVKAQEMGPVLAAKEPSTLRTIGILEILGAIGVILPVALDILPWIAAVAAVGLALIQLLAIPQHIKLQDTKGLPFNVVLLALALFVALGRSGAIP